MKTEKVSNILIIGCGGTGSMLAVPLARFIYSLRDRFVGKIVFADGDTYSDSNTDRQNFNPKFLGMNKAEYTAMSIESNLPQLADKIGYLDKYLSKDDVLENISDNTIVINCADNKAIRKHVEDRVNDLGRAGATVVHICCGNEMVRGQVQINYWNQGQLVTNSIFDKHPEFNDINDDRSEMTCEQLAELPSGGQVIVANHMAASLALMYLWQVLSDEVEFFKDGTFLPNSGTSFQFGFGSFSQYQQRKVVLE